MPNNRRPHLLILNNGTTEIPISRLHEHFEREGLSTQYFWAANGEFPEDVLEFDGVLITGSPHGAYEDLPWINREHILIQELAQAGLPMLGICFGSQILASALAGRDQVFRRDTCEVGFVDLNLTSEAATDPLMAGQDSTVFMYVWHNDEVKAGHSDVRILAHTPECPNHIWRFRDQMIWGVQGHPELTKAQALQAFDKHEERLEKDGADVNHLRETATDTQEAKAILKNFASIVKNHAQANSNAFPREAVRSIE